MANTLYHSLDLQSIDLDTLVQVVETARSATQDQRWLNAINEAYDFLLNPHTDTIQIADDGTAIIPSNTGDHDYKANGTCQCKAFAHGKQPCWHRAASRIIQRYREYLEAEADRLMHLVEKAENTADPRYDKLEAEWTRIELLLAEVQR
jgi:hypothetical protein